jgi:hypothetical protein
MYSSRRILGRHDVSLHFEIGRILLGLRLWYGRLVCRLFQLVA